MKNRLLILFSAFVASVTINTVYSTQSDFINGCITELVLKQAQIEISMRKHPSAQIRVLCKPNDYREYLFARVVARYGIDAVENVLTQKIIEGMTTEQIIDFVLSCKDLELPLACFYSPLIHLAACYNNVPVLKLLLKKGDCINLGVPFRIKYSADTAGCWCFISDINCNTCSIIPSQEILVFPHNSQGSTPLHLAVFGRAKDAVSFFLQQDGVKIDGKIIMLALKSFPYAGSANDMQIACDIFQMLLESMKTLNINFEISCALVWLEKHKPSILKKY